MYSRNVIGIRGIAVAAVAALTNSAASQAQQKSAKELIAGSWTLMIADNVSREGNKAPGFGPLPTGTARFSTDGRYSFEVVPSTGKQSGVSASGTYTLDEAGKALTLKVDSELEGHDKDRRREVRLKRSSGLDDFSAARGLI
jgi:hypothetical protein